MPRIVKFGVIPFFLLVAAIGIASLVLDDGGSGGTPESLVIEVLIPSDGDKVLQQGEVGVDLLTGWDAHLTINGVRIPEEELIRLDEFGLITFKPGEGRAVEALQAGQNCASATYWQKATGPDHSFTRTWCFSGV